MNAERWQQLVGICRLAFERPEAERRGYLDQACGGDAALRSEIDSLLARDAGAGSFLEPPSSAAVLGLTGEPGADSPVGRRIGRYTLRGVLGRGGMGVVYEAEQESPRRLVALKVLRAVPWLDELTPRLFAREGQALARLEHPGIAAIHEAGRGDDGCYYFAMERVAGVPLTQYAQDRQLSICERLELFARVCDAVHYAHQRGVIHRDLKPSNILVAEEGTEARRHEGTKGESGPSLRASVPSCLRASPKILDFGLARIVDAGADQTRITHPGGFQGTPAYASPEQASGRIDQIDVRSDVYSLGVVLYELVVGQAPFELRNVPLPEAVRRICSDPPRPPRAAGRSVDRDLETILLKALEKPPDRRYASVAALAQDVRRYLARQPILARPASLSYQMSMFVRRHRALTAGVLAAAVLLVGGVASTTAMWLRARAAAALATRQMTDKDFINQFLLTAFRAASPELSGRDLTVRQLLDDAAARLQAETTANPLVLADLHVIVGDAYAALTLNQQARPHFEQAAELRRSQLGETHADTLDAQRRAFHVLAEGGRRREGSDQLRELLGRCRKALGDQHPVTIATLMDWVSVEPVPPRGPNPERMRASDEQIQQFVELARAALRQYEGRLGSDHEDTLVAKRTLAYLYAMQDEVEEAARLTREIVAQLRPSAASDPRKRAALADALANLSRQLVSLRRIDEADAAIREALEIDVELHGENHGRTLGHRGARLDVLHFQGRLPEEEAEVRALAAGTRAFYGPHRQSVLAATQLGQFLLRQGRPDEARAVFAEADEMCRVVDGPLSEGRMKVFAAALGRVEPQELAAALVADAQRTVREGAATEVDTLRFFLTSLSDHRMWVAALELVRRVLDQPRHSPDLSVEQAAGILADVVESCEGRPDPRDGAPFRAAMLDLLLGRLDAHAPGRERLRLLRNRLQAALSVPTPR